MPFALRFTYNDLSIKEIKPLAPDNPTHGLESGRIATNANRIAGKLNGEDNDFKASVYHYSDIKNEKPKIQTPLGVYRKVGFTVKYETA